MFPNGDLDMLMIQTGPRHLPYLPNPTSYLCIKDCKQKEKNTFAIKTCTCILKVQSSQIENVLNEMH